MASSNDDRGGTHKRQLLSSPLQAQATSTVMLVGLVMMS